MSAYTKPSVDRAADILQDWDEQGTWPPSHPRIIATVAGAVTATAIAAVCPPARQWFEEVLDEVETRGQNSRMDKMSF